MRTNVVPSRKNRSLVKPQSRLTKPGSGSYMETKTTTVWVYLRFSEHLSCFLCFFMRKDASLAFSNNGKLLRTQDPNPYEEKSTLSLKQVQLISTNNNFKVGFVAETNFRRWSRIFSLQFHKTNVSNTPHKPSTFIHRLLLNTLSKPHICRHLVATCFNYHTMLARFPP